MSVNSKMTAIADKIRTLLGITGSMGLDAMATNIGNAVNEVDAQDTLIQQIIAALNGKTAGGGSSQPTMAIKSGTTTSRTINTGLSDIEQFFIYKESLNTTGLIHLHYTKSATSRLYASAWNTNNYGSKTVTNGTGGTSVSGGSITISATQATQGALSSNITYKWIAIGTE